MNLAICIECGFMDSALCYGLTLAEACAVIAYTIKHHDRQWFNELFGNVGRGVRANSVHAQPFCRLLNAGLNKLPIHWRGVVYRVLGRT